MMFDCMISQELAVFSPDRGSCVGEVAEPVEGAGRLPLHFLLAEDNPRQSGNESSGLAHVIVAPQHSIG